MHLRATRVVLRLRVRGCRGAWIATLLRLTGDRGAKRLHVLQLHHDSLGGLRRPDTPRWPRSGPGGNRKSVRGDLPGHGRRGPRGQHGPYTCTAARELRRSGGGVRTKGRTLGDRYAVVGALLDSTGRRRWPTTSSVSSMFARTAPDYVLLRPLGFRVGSF